MFERRQMSVMSSPNLARLSDEIRMRRERMRERLGDGGVVEYYDEPEPCGETGLLHRFLCDRH